MLEREVMRKAGTIFLGRVIRGSFSGENFEQIPGLCERGNCVRVFWIILQMRKARAESLREQQDGPQ